MFLPEAQEDAFGNFERVAAYCECLKKYGMTLDDNPILCGDYDYETGVNYMREYVHSGSKLPDVLSVQMTILRQESVQRQNSGGTAYRTIFW